MAFGKKYQLRSPPEHIIGAPVYVDDILRICDNLMNMIVSSTTVDMIYCVFLQSI